MASLRAVGASHPRPRPFPNSMNGVIMKTGVIFAFGLLCATMVSAQTPVEQPSPAQQKIALAKKTIENYPERYEAYNQLALALTHRAREHADPAYLQRAEKALKDSFRIMPDNFAGRKIRVQILLGKHEFTQALEEAKVLNRRAPDDILTYGLVADAMIELGDYKGAVDAAQWMLDMHPGNVPGLKRAAALRSLHGDVQGAVDLLEQAYDRISPYEVHERAWILTRIADLKLMTGKVEAAEKLLQYALQLFPRYHLALGGLSKVRLAQQEYAEAVDLLRQRFEAAPHHETLYALAKALEKAGRSAEAKAAFHEFEQQARGVVERARNANRELVFYYADHAHEPTEALHIARREIARRRDVYTLDAHAWALYVNGRYPEARRQLELALAVGIRDAKFLYHAGAIASKLHDGTTAQRYLTQSLDLSPRSEVGTAARQALGSIGPAKTHVSLDD